MPAALLIRVRIQDGRYYGVPDWPPSPARLFQALLAGAGLSGPIDEAGPEWGALLWLEQRCIDAPPLIGAPPAWCGQQVMLYMPNNDLDRVGGDPLRMAEVRTAHKFLRPYIFDTAVPFLYAWPLEESQSRETHADVICALAERLYQFGRGVDMAWAWADLLDVEQLEQVLAEYRGRIYRPSRGGRGLLACPMAGSLKSLGDRYQSFGRRFERSDQQVKPVFSKAPQPRFRSIAYDARPFRRVYELREPSPAAAFVAWPLVDASGLVELVRNGAMEKLRHVLPAQSELIGRVLIGRKPDGSNDCPIGQRVRIIPLPSIGHEHADHAIRRVLIEVPGNCPLEADDAAWAFSGLDLVDIGTGEVRASLTPGADDAFLNHHGLENSASRIWRSVTPLVLPQKASRRRIEPARKRKEVKDARERSEELARAAFAVRQALRHAGIEQQPDRIGLQREPFQGNGARAEAFAAGTRFAKERLWHVEMVFSAPLAGPLIIGDGRFLGLGLMAPIEANCGIHAFQIRAGLEERAEPDAIALAARRAVMARVQERLGKSIPLPAFFSGHELNGAPAASSHLAFIFDARHSRLLVVAPHVLEHRPATPREERHLSDLQWALAGFEQLRAGPAGCLKLRPSTLTPDDDPLFAPALVWESVTPYLVTHHVKRSGAAVVLAADLRAECRRRGLPEPLEVLPLELQGIPRLGLSARARLTFKSAVVGPILLGKSRYRGGGLFAPARGAVNE